MKESAIQRIVFVFGAWCLGACPSDCLFAETYPQNVHVISVASTNEHDLIINWQPVAADVYGQSKGISNYNIYVSSDPLFAPDLLAHTNRLASTNRATFTHVHALENATSCFYYVTAVTSNGLESPVFTDMVCKLSRTIECPSGSNTFAWMATPDNSPWTNASSLAAWLRSADKLYRWDASHQEYEVWNCVAFTGVNFSVHAGEAIGVEVFTTTVVHLLGKVNPTNLFVWTHYTNQFNHRWIALPPNSIYGFVSALATSIPGATKAARYVGPPEYYQSWFLLGSNWLGTNFVLRPEEGYLVSIKTNSTWQPKLSYPQVSVTLSRGMEFLQSAAGLQATAQVSDAEGDIVEYRWDYEGDGVMDATSTTPVLSYAANLTNPAVWYPSLWVRDQRGFLGMGYDRYQALSLSLIITNQLFRPDLGQTGTISYASSTNGAFTTWICDVQGNVVRVLESNVWHAAGQAVLAWDGRNGSGATMTGVYYAVIVQQVGTNTATYNPAALLAGVNLTDQLSGVSAPSNLNLRAGGLFPIQYTLSAPAWVTVCIVDATNGILAVVCANAPRLPGAHEEYWNGRLSNGSLIEAGQSFSASITALAMGDNALIVDPPLPRIDGLTKSADRFMPAMNPYGVDTNSIILSYSLANGTDVRMEVRAADGRFVRSVIDPGKPPGGNQTVWSGTDDGGRMVAEGYYSIALCSEVGGVRGGSSTVWVGVYY
jgi:flagellar hook assembly protein FlgD